MLLICRQNPFLTSTAVPAENDLQTCLPRPPVHGINYDANLDRDPSLFEQFFISSYTSAGPEDPLCYGEKIGRELQTRIASRARSPFTSDVGAAAYRRLALGLPI